MCHNYDVRERIESGPRTPEELAEEADGEDEEEQEVGEPPVADD